MTWSLSETQPEARDAAAFDALHDAPERWLPAVQALAARWAPSGTPLVPVLQSTALVVMLGSDRVLKVYPPLLRDHWAYETAALPLFQGQLELPTPHMLDVGSCDGWPYVLLSRLPGEVLTAHWAALAEAQRLTLLHTLGRITAQAHARVNVAALRPHAPVWATFVAQQRAKCLQRQQRTGLPAHLLADVANFVDAGPLLGCAPDSRDQDVALTGEYTPMNLLVHSGPSSGQLSGQVSGQVSGQLSGMFDFGDGLVGPRLYDWLGPLTFLASGHAERVDAYLDGYRAVAGDAPEWRHRVWRDTALRLLLLHRYSHLKAQIACPGWDDPQRVPDCAALARFLWPE